MQVFRLNVATFSIFFLASLLHFHEIGLEEHKCRGYIVELSEITKTEFVIYMVVTASTKENKSSPKLLH